MNDPTDDPIIDLADPPATDPPADPPAGTPPPAAPAEPPWAALAGALEKLAARPDPAPAPPAPTNGQPQLTAEQLKNINAELSTKLFTDPLGVIAPIAAQMAREQVETMRQQFEPYRDVAAEAFIDRFKTRMKDEDQLYKQTVKAFDESLADVDLRTLAARPKAEQQRTLGLYWNAAKGEVLSKKVKNAGGPPPGSSAGGGAGIGAGAPRGGGGGGLSDQEKNMLYRSMPKAEADAAIRDIEASMA